MPQTHPSFFVDAERELAAWKSANEKLAALEGPYNALVAKIGQAQQARVNATAASGVLAQLEDVTGPVAELKTLEAARAQLTNEMHSAMRYLKQAVTEHSGPAYAGFR